MKLLLSRVPLLVLGCILTISWFSLSAETPLRIGIVSRGEPDPEGRGSAHFSVNFYLTTTSTGWIIQKVTWASFPRHCGGQPIQQPENRKFFEYWEAWKVRDGNVEMGFTGKPHLSDTFLTVPEAERSNGTVGAVGRVAFFENYNTDESKWDFGKIPEAGELPTTTSPPDLWEETWDTRYHNMLVTWESCPPVSFSTVETLPETSDELRSCSTRKVKERNSSTLETRLTTCPTWMRAEGHSKLARQVIVAVALDLVSLPFESLRDQAVAYQRDHQKDLSAMSKLYIFNRVLFKVPGRVRLGSIPFFGGFGGVPIRDGFVHVLWPLRADSSGTLTLDSAVSSYGGEPYDAVREFDYFYRRFGLRSR